MSATFRCRMALMTAHLLAKNQVLILLPSWCDISTVSVKYEVSLSAGVSLLQKLAHHSHGTKHIGIRRYLANGVRPVIFAMHSQTSEFKMSMRTYMRISIPCFQNFCHKAHQFLEVESR